MKNISFFPLAQRSVFIVLAIILMKNARAQGDGSVPSSQFYLMLQNNYNKETAKNFDSSAIGSTTTLSVYVHAINNIEGNINGINSTDIAAILGNINYYFKPIGIRFQLVGFEVVKEYVYGIVNNYYGNAELIKKYQVQHCINLYLVDTISINDENYYGFTAFPDDTANNSIFLTKNALAYKPLMVQLGHYFGLLSTYDHGTGAERVDESNCSTTGDLICDTYADPGMANSMDEGCQYIGSAMDPTGSYYIPSVANFMTDSPFSCRCIFTPDQYRRMYFYYKNFRNYLR